MKLELLMTMFGAKFSLLRDKVLYNPYAHSLDSDSYKDMFVSIKQRAIHTLRSIEVITMHHLL
jgi:hypothetical protein